jgi:hypothetical protein
MYMYMYMNIYIYLHTQIAEVPESSGKTWKIQASLLSALLVTSVCGLKLLVHEALSY